MSYYNQNNTDLNRAADDSHSQNGNKFKIQRSIREKVTLNLKEKIKGPICNTILEINGFQNRSSEKISKIYVPHWQNKNYLFITFKRTSSTTLLNTATNVSAATTSVSPPPPPMTSAMYSQSQTAGTIVIHLPPSFVNEKINKLFLPVEEIITLIKAGECLRNDYKQLWKSKYYSSPPAPPSSPSTLNTSLASSVVDGIIDVHQSGSGLLDNVESIMKCHI